MSPTPHKTKKDVYKRYTLYNWTIYLLYDFSSCYMYYAYKMITFKNYYEMEACSVSDSFGENCWVYNFDS